MVASQFRFGGHGGALALGDRDQGHLREDAVDRLEVRQVQAAVQGRDAFVGEVLEQHMLEQVDMEMEDVELLGTPPHLVEHHEM